MRTDKRRCPAHNTILGLRETCPKCAEAKRREVLARAPKSAPCPSPWENLPPPDWTYPASKYDPNQSPLAKSYTYAGRLAVLEDFATTGFFWPAAEPKPFSPETFCPPGREALRRAGYVDSVTRAADRDVLLLRASYSGSAGGTIGTIVREEISGERVTGDQAERFLTFAWETMALDAGLDGLLAQIEEEDE